MLKKLPLASALMVLSVSATAADLMEVYEAARASDPQLAIAEANARGSAAGVGVARAALLPQINASYGKDRSWQEFAQLGPDPAGPPLSSTESCAFASKNPDAPAPFSLVRSRVETRRVPPFGIASVALTTRVIRTRVSSVGEPQTWLFD